MSDHPTYINLTRENIDSEHLCCIIRSKADPPGVACKRRWLQDRLTQGHVFRKLDEKGTAFIEYAPLQYAWTPIQGDNYLYIYCLWTLGEQRGKGHGRALMTYCLEDARRQGKAGICMLGARKQKAWLTDQAFAKQFGFDVVDETSSGYQLLAYSLDGTLPHFTPDARRERIDSQLLTIYYSPQCPYILKSVELARSYCMQRALPITLKMVDTLEKAKSLPCPFNNFAVFYRGTFRTVNLLDEGALRRLLK